MQLFYTNDFLDDSTARLRDGEWKHCRNVLRYTEGDFIRFVDGRGGLYEGRLSRSMKNEGFIQVEKFVDNWKKRSYRIHIAVSPTKQMARIEWVLEKMTEIGLDRLTLIGCDRSERNSVKLERLQKIAISAMKQSQQAYVPVIEGIIRYEDFLETNKVQELKLLAHLNESAENIHTNYQPGKDVIIVIGPEGDFTEDEIAKALNTGFRTIHLGENRLRTETAALVACHTIHFINQIQ